MALMNSAGDPDFSQIIESLDVKCREVFSKPLLEDMDEVVDYKRSMSELESCSSDLYDSTVNLKSITIRMLNVGYAMRHCKVRRVEHIFNISDISIFLKLLEKQGLIPTSENKSGNSTLNSSYTKLKRKSEKTAEISSPLLQVLLKRYKETEPIKKEGDLVLEDF